MVQYSILIADGDPEYIQYLSGTLRANGFQTTGTSSGANALDQYRSQELDLVLADMDLADLDGLTLLEELRKFDSNAKVILTTNLASKELIARAFRSGALDVLEKPLNFEFLTDKIRELVNREDRALEGNLKMMSLASIVQINCEERNQAMLRLNYQGRNGVIYFRDGEMIHAEANGKTGEEAVYELLGWEDGAFQVQMGAQPSLRTISTPWSGVILEGMRRIDESTAGWSPDWEEELGSVQEQDHQVQQRIARAILSTSEVSSAVICTPDGTELAQENSRDPESDLQLGLRISEKAELIGGFLEGGDLTRAVLMGSENRFYLQPSEGNLILLTLTKRSSAETIYKSLNTILKRYQSAV